MRLGYVYYNSDLAGIITETDEGEYTLDKIDEIIERSFLSIRNKKKCKGLVNTRLQLFC